MNNFSRHNHGDQNLVIQSHELMDDIDLRMHDDILKKDHVIRILVGHCRVELADLDYVDLALIALQAGDSVFVPEQSFPIKCEVNILVFGQSLQDGEILGLNY